MSDELRQRQPRVEDRKFLAFVRSKPCCVCQRGAPSQAAHIRMISLAHGKRECGKNEKPDDRWTVPLCVGCHLNSPLSVHRKGEEIFWRTVGWSPFQIAIMFRADYETSGGIMMEVPPDRRPKRPGEKYWQKKRQLQRRWPKGRKIQNRRKR